MAQFAEVQKASLYESVAAALEDAILSGELKLGEKLPSEQSLAAQFGVSRNILREAIKAVEARGLLDVRNGDGSYIARPNVADLGKMLNRFLILSNTAILEYYEIRSALEVKACELAALRATKEDGEALESLVDQMQQGLTSKENLTRLDYDFHLRIAQATKNRLFPSFLEPLKQLMTDMFNYTYPNTKGRNEALVWHRRILQAIKSKDPVLAREAMMHHLESSETNVAQMQNDFSVLNQSEEQT